jgi:hypothetical protein
MNIRLKPVQGDSKGFVVVRSLGVVEVTEAFCTSWSRIRKMTSTLAATPWARRMANGR